MCDLFLCLGKVYNGLPRVDRLLNRLRPFRWLHQNGQEFVFKKPCHHIAPSFCPSRLIPASSRYFVILLPALSRKLSLGRFRSKSEGPGTSQNLSQSNPASFCCDIFCLFDPHSRFFLHCSAFTLQHPRIIPSLSAKKEEDLFPLLLCFSFSAQRFLP